MLTDAGYEHLLCIPYIWCVFKWELLVFLLASCHFSLFTAGVLTLPLFFWLNISKFGSHFFPSCPSSSPVFLLLLAKWASINPLVHLEKVFTAWLSGETFDMSDETLSARCIHRCLCDIILEGWRCPAVSADFLSSVTVQALRYVLWWIYIFPVSGGTHIIGKHSISASISCRF